MNTKQTNENIDFVLAGALIFLGIPLPPTTSKRLSDVFLFLLLYTSSLVYIAVCENRVGGRVDLDVTECLRGVLPFGPHDAPWMGAVRAILGGGEVRNILSEEGRNGFGCVISKPEGEKQNWHKDGDTTRGGEEQPKMVIVFFANND